MQLVMTAFAVVAGMIFSLAVAITVEEVIFGKVIGPLFARQTAPAKAGRER